MARKSDVKLNSVPSRNEKARSPMIVRAIGMRGSVA